VLGDLRLWQKMEIIVQQEEEALMEGMEMVDMEVEDLVVGVEDEVEVSGGEEEDSEVIGSGFSYWRSEHFGAFGGSLKIMLYYEVKHKIVTFRVITPSHSLLSRS